MTKIYCLSFIVVLIIFGIIGIIVTKKSVKRDYEQFEKWLNESEEEE